ncbi:hypothetical protein QBC36DRAFT_366488 [Triangularia setosa]|uniref:Uncharacterized protein n=1 Tax=Triangularia setosa TaxID=2587417 RepID=A0AAN6W0F8_9PEZI|nr:hypothetical protein QBC36DRAFT_366488 [Podospora setosa]
MPAARYESLTQSDTENAASESTGYDGSDDESEWDSNGCNADPLGIRMEVRKEVGELGGWWPFIKKFRIFLKFMWPFGNAPLKNRLHSLIAENKGFGGGTVKVCALN